LGGRPPVVDLAREKLLATVIAAAAERGHLSAAHDLSDGGLAQALVESCLRYGVGAAIALPEHNDPFVELFAESTGRALVAVPRGHEKAFTGLVDEHGLPWTPIGVVAARSATLDFRGLFSVALDELRRAFTGTLPAYFGSLATAPAPASTPAAPAPAASAASASGGPSSPVPSGADAAPAEQAGTASAAPASAPVVADSSAAETEPEDAAPPADEAPSASASAEADDEPAADAE
jgi:phosphoribosylformylglycinamidine synthase